MQQMQELNSKDFQEKMAKMQEKLKDLDMQFCTCTVGPGKEKQKQKTMPEAPQAK